MPQASFEIISGIHLSTIVALFLLQYLSFSFILPKLFVYTKKYIFFLKKLNSNVIKSYNSIFINNYYKKASAFLSLIK